ncbi:MAG: DJ-1/PfpI family protein [Candidatus Omnitrophica bacterium]|nr:DJ-1/PfpI family protein [Candidatus Omnitrophota bacterium]
MAITAIVALAAGFEEIEAITAIDMLRRAGITVSAAAIGSELKVRGAHDIVVEADTMLESLFLVPDALVLPGGMPGAENLAKSPRLDGLLRQCRDQRKVIAAICAAPAVVLAPKGFLDGRRATCYPGCEQQFSRATTYVNEGVVVDGRLITAGGPGTALAFSLAIVRALCGAVAAEAIGERALAAPPPGRN